MVTKIKQVNGTPEWERITPKKAEQWLNQNTCNRKLREGVAEAYAEDMKLGHWTECYDPIAFYADGELANGQHRLFAIVLSGTTQTFLVVRGVTQKAALNFDVGRPRSIVDNAHISGLDKELTNEMVSTARAYHAGKRSLPGTSTITNTRKLEFVAAYREPCKWALKHAPRRINGLRNAATMAAIARAYSHIHAKEVERLEAFCKVLDSGVGNGETDSAAIALRDYLIANPHASRAEGEFREAFMKTQNAIWYFLRAKPLRRIVAIKTEAYPNKSPV